MCGLPTGSGLIACIVFPFSTAMESCWSMPRFLLVCHAKSVAWTNCVIFSGLIIWATVLRYFSCLASLDGPLVTNSLFSQTCLITCICSGLGVLRKPPLPSRVEREETFNTPLWGGFWQDTDVQRDLLHSGSTHSSSRGECQHSGPGRSGEGRKEPPTLPHVFSVRLISFLVLSLWIHLRLTMCVLPFVCSPSDFIVLDLSATQQLPRSNRNLTTSEWHADRLYANNLLHSIVHDWGSRNTNTQFNLYPSKWQYASPCLLTTWSPLKAAPAPPPFVL